MADTKNTLFRFATMRSPELINDEDKEKGFIMHPNPAVNGFFHEEIADPEDTPSEQMAALKTKAETFEPITTIAGLKTAFGEAFVGFANWLARNRKAVAENKTGYVADAAAKLAISGFPENISEVWDNLFYQLITDKSPSLREQLIQVIIAHNYAYGVDQEVADIHEAAVARVVIPKEFYGLGEGSTNPVNTVAENVSLRSKEQLNKVFALADAEEKIAQFNTAIKDFEKAEKKWYKSNQEAYKTAKAIYDADIAEILESAETVTDPETGITSYVNLDLPAFIFEPLAQITEGLSADLPVASYTLAEELGLLEDDTFQEVIEGLRTAKQKETAKLFDAVPLSNKMIAMNNVVLPSTLKGTEDLYSFVLTMYEVTPNHYRFKFAIYIGYQGKADSVSYNSEIDSIIDSSTDFSSKPVGDSTLVGLYPNTIEVPSGIDTIRLFGKIKLDNGVVLIFDTDVSIPDGAEGVMEVEGSESSGGDGDEGNSFVPSFGLRRLGIADYRKVEQSVCCYVPGEVSHIENVMAREYKERSTRRLRRSEDTITSERQVEREDLTDTTSTSRYEMQQEVSNVIRQDMSTGINTNTNVDLVKGQFSISSNFAYNTSQEQSNHQAITYAQDITQRAMERVVEKVREERVTKIIEEFEEQNKHGFDNRKGTAHVSGVYRWIDKVYKNQVLNYGKRLMYEFMIPKPATFHLKAMEAMGNNPGISVLEKPVDPRSDGFLKLSDFTNIDETNYAYWAGKYNAEVEICPQKSITLSFGMAFSSASEPAASNGGVSKAEKFDIPEGYEAISAKGKFHFAYLWEDLEWNTFSHVHIGGSDYKTLGQRIDGNDIDTIFNKPITKELGVAINTGDLGSCTLNLYVTCNLTKEAYKAWQLKTFTAIIEAYAAKLQAYNDAVAKLNAPLGTVQTNPGFYRQIENTVLKKNCISYLVSHDKMGKYNLVTGNTVTGMKVKLDQDMEDYSSLVKFMEQAFEWDIMGYIFYPFFWGDKNSWHKAYQQDVNDPLFRSFLQSGMARVIVTVRPGFEEAVMHYMATGKIWNGGQVPVVGDDLYLSIVEELKNPVYAVDETWETRVPTTLTVIQSGSIGLNAEGLPCDCGDDTGIEQINSSLGVVTDADEDVVTLAAGATQWSVPSGTLIEKLLITEESSITFSAGTTSGEDDWVSEVELEEGGIVVADKYFNANTLVFFNGVTPNTVIKIYKK